jgi:hypothetical protein
MDSPTQDPTAPGTAAKPNSRIDPEPVTDDQSPSEAFHHAQMRLSELAEYVSYLIAAKVDGIKLTLRNVAIFAALGIVGLIAGGAMVVTSVVLLCYGVARGLGVLFGGRIWLGDLVTGILLLALIAGGTMFALKSIGKSSRERTAKKYAARQQQQRAKFGQDVRQRAGDTPN